MVQIDSFKKWLKDNTEYSDAVIGDTASRMKRADSILEWNESDTYLFFLENEQKPFCHFLRLHPSTAFQTFLLNIRATPFL